MAKRSSRGNRTESQGSDRPSRLEAENAVRTLIPCAGDNPSRAGMAGTSARVARAYEEWFAGYARDPRDYLAQTFAGIAGYDEIVALRDIPFESHCEHHRAPIIGKTHVGYPPRKRVVVSRSLRGWLTFTPSGFRSWRR